MVIPHSMKRQATENQDDAPESEMRKLCVPEESDGVSIPIYKGNGKGKGKETAEEANPEDCTGYDGSIGPRKVDNTLTDIKSGVRPWQDASGGPSKSPRYAALSTLPEARDFGIHGGYILTAGGDIYYANDSSKQRREESILPSTATSTSPSKSRSSRTETNFDILDTSGDSNAAQTRLSTLTSMFQSMLKFLRPNETSIDDIIQKADTRLYRSETLMMPRDVETYSRLMLRFRKGYPLYDPRPVGDVTGTHWRKGVRVGDVGRVTPDGTFDFLFNVNPMDTSNTDTHPFEGFETIQRVWFSDNRNFFPPGENFLVDVVEKTGTLPVTYEFSGAEGAILQLPEGAAYFGARNIEDFRTFAARHAQQWYEYMNVESAMGAPNGSLYLVTGCIKCKNCGTAVFYGPYPCQNRLEFHAGDQALHPRYSWRKSGPISHRIGESEDDQLRQCVFIRGFKITLGDEPWNRLMKIAVSEGSSRWDGAGPLPKGRANSSTTQASSGSASDNNSAASQNQLRTNSAIVQELSSPASPTHPSDFINPMLLWLHPEANVALLHDDDWCRWPEHVFASDTSSIQPEGVLRSMDNFYETKVDQYGCVSLVQNTTQLASNPTSVRTSTDSHSLHIKRSSKITAQSQPNEDTCASQGPQGSHNIIPLNFEPVSLTSTFSEELIPVTDQLAQECPRFRVLIVGRSGVGKSSLINAVFKTSFALVEHNKAGYADINREITSPYNNRFVLHDSHGHEPGDDKKFNLLEKFIYERSRKRSVADRLHAIWLCISVPYVGGRTFETGDKKLLKLNRNKVPVVVVFTKYDLLVSAVKVQMWKSGEARGGRGALDKRCQELAAERFEESCVIPLKVLTKDIPDVIPYSHVSISQPDTLAALVDVTMRNIYVEITTTRRIVSLFASRTAREKASPREHFADSAQVALAAAQRVHLDNKISASIKVGNQKYWSELASGMHFLNKSLARCLFVLHKDIVTSWNIRDPTDHLSSRPFRARMTYIVEDLDDNTGGNQPEVVGSAMGVAAAAAGIAAAIAPVSGPATIVVAPVAAGAFLAAWSHDVYRRTPANVRCLMAYVVDLTTILQAIFRASLTDKDGNVDEERIKEIVDKFDRSETKKDIHGAIRSLVHDQNMLAKEGVVDKIEQLIHQHRAFSG